MPNLDERYVWSIAKGEAERATALAPTEVGARVPCLAGCGTPVGPGMKCAACATAAVVSWKDAREAVWLGKSRAHIEAIGRRMAQRIGGQ